jgi:hypothetical protein
MYNNSAQTSVWETEPAKEAYVIPFAPELIEFIKAKRKFITYRFGLKYNYLQAGDKVNIKETGSSETGMPAIITAKESVVFKDLPLNTEGHETYIDKKEQRQVFSGYYKYIGRAIKDDDVFLVITFRLLD